MARRVSVNGQIADKPGSNVHDDDALHVSEPEHPWVGRGGIKLAHALEQFHIGVRGKNCADIGASTGGFTDVLLKNGAAKVYAIDVGYGQLDASLRNDPRVVVRERINARYLEAKDFDEPIDFVCADVSFISLTLILPNAFDLVNPNGVILALIKPQFELERGEVGRGGVVRKPELHQKAQDKIVAFVNRFGHSLIGIVPAAITGTDGNQEFFACIQKRSA